MAQFENLFDTQTETNKHKQTSCTFAFANAQIPKRMYLKNTNGSRQRTRTHKERGKETGGEHIPLPNEMKRKRKNK